MRSVDNGTVGNNKINTKTFKVSFKQKQVNYLDYLQALSIVVKL